MGLEAFSSKQSSSSRRDHPVPPSSAPDKDRCPRGWDSDIWFLALVFEALADEQDIRLRAGRPVIYAELDSRIKHSGIRQQEVPYSSEELLSVVSRELYPNPVLRGPLWRQFVQVMIYEFWSRFRDENAASEFAQRLVFIDTWDAVTASLDAKRAK